MGWTHRGPWCPSSSRRPRSRRVPNLIIWLHDAHGPRCAPAMFVTVCGDSRRCCDRFGALTSSGDHVRLTYMRSSLRSAVYVVRDRFLCCSRRRWRVDQVLPHDHATCAVHVETGPDVSVCTLNIHIDAQHPCTAPSQHSRWRPSSAAPSIRSYVPRVVGKRRKSTSGGPTDGKTSRLGGQRLGHNISDA